MNQQFTKDEAIDFLKKFQEKHKLTLTQFAEKLGVSTQYLSNVYGGKNQLPSEKVGFEKITAFILTGKLDDIVHG